MIYYIDIWVDEFPDHAVRVRQKCRAVVLPARRR